MSTEPKSINQNDADTFIPEELAEKIRRVGADMEKIKLDAITTY